MTNTTEVSRERIEELGEDHSTITFSGPAHYQPGDMIKLTTCDYRWWRRLLYFIFTLGTKRPMRHEYHVVRSVDGGTITSDRT